MSLISSKLTASQRTALVNKIIKSVNEKKYQPIGSYNNIINQPICDQLYTPIYNHAI